MICALGRNLPKNTIFGSYENLVSYLGNLQSTGFIPAKCNFLEFFLKEKVHIFKKVYICSQNSKKILEKNLKLIHTTA